MLFPIIYHFMWLNEKPELTSFASHQIPADVQCDSAKRIYCFEKDKSQLSRGINGITSTMDTPIEWHNGHSCIGVDVMIGSTSKVTKCAVHYYFWDNWLLSL